MSTPSTRAAIVTGASRGIGRDIAFRLAQDGHAVAVGYAHDPAKAQEVVTAIVNGGGRALAIQADVSVQDDVERLFSTAQSTFGRLDAVVCSAGVMGIATVRMENVADFDTMMAVNARGTFLVLAKAAETLAEGGRIVALSSSVIAKALPGYGPYIASKAAVEGLIHVLANELRGRGITVNAVAPGPVATELFFKGKTEEQVAMLSNMAPLERLGEPTDIAGAVSFLLGPDGGWVHGQVLRVNGGFA